MIHSFHKWLTLSLAFFACLAQPCLLSQAAEPDIDPTLLEAAKEYDAAYLAQDPDRLDRILAPEYFLTDSTGKVRDRAALISEARTGRNRVESAATEDGRFRVYGTTAIATGRWTEKNTFDGIPSEGAHRFTTVYVKTDGRWRVVSDQVTPILPTDARTAIEALHRKYTEARTVADADAIADGWTLDAWSISPGKPMVKGREAILKITRAHLSRPPAEQLRMKLENLEIEEHGDWAYHIGTFKDTTPDGTLVDEGVFMGIWKREDGEWKLHRDIWNSSLPVKEQVKQ